MDKFQIAKSSSSKKSPGEKNLPKWMIPKSGFVHPLYEQIWQYVKSEKRNRTCDTNLVSQLLMTSGLPVDVLGGLWSMANVGIEGSLSQQELYIILALVTLVQNGYSISNVSLLQHIHKPIIPRLNYALIEKKHGSTIKTNIEHKPQQASNKSNIIPKIDYQQNFHQPTFDMISSENYDPLAVTFVDPKNQMSRMMPSLTANSEPKSLDLTPVNNDFDTFDDEFSDFQCAQFTNTDSKNNYEFTDFQSAFDSLSVKESNKNVEKDKGIELLNASSIDVVSSSVENQENLIDYRDDAHDKYEVFRTLAAETVDIENNHNDLLDVDRVESIDENIQNYDVYDDEFGDFLYVEEVSSSKPDILVDWKNVQIQCINKCLEFLQEGLSTFSRISDEKILMEVINHNKGVKYVTQLNLISQICKRILKNCSCPSLDDDLAEVVSKLETYISDFTNELTKSIHSEVLDSTNKVTPCYLCKCDCSADSIEYMLNYYHTSCINLLMNFVQTSQLSVK